MAGDLAGQVAVVTGAAQGIGAACAQALAQVRGKDGGNGARTAHDCAPLRCRSHR